MQKKKIAVAVALACGVSFNAVAGALDGGVAPGAGDVAVTGTITTGGGYNTVVGSGATITDTGSPSSPAEWNDD